ncbi:MAG: C25 family cysteine peptidase, partial [bacterium]
MKTMVKIGFTVLFSISLTIGSINTSVAADKKKPKVTKDKDVMTFEYEFDAPEIITEDDFDIVTINGFERYSKAGEPVIPVKPAAILIPPGEKIVDITSTAVDTIQLPGPYRLPHGNKPFRRFADKPGEPSKPDPTIFEMNDFWPGKYHELLTIQSNRGYNIAYVNLFPLQYLPQRGVIRMAGKLHLIIRFASFDTPHRIKPTKKLKEKLERKIDNPDTLLLYDTYSDEGPSIPARSAEGSSALSDPACPYYGANYNYIVITNSSLANEENIPDPSFSFQALCASKTARGITAGVVTTEWIFANYDGTKPSGGTDNATRIRNFLIDAYQTWGTEYALLGGDKDIVPVRKFEDSDDSIPADLYYGCVDPPENTFDNDGDGKYGESKDGPEGVEVDLTAEIFTGRAAVENGQEVVNFVRKTLTYESTDDDYLNVVGTMGGYLGFGGIQEFTKPFCELIRQGSNLYLGHFTHGFENPIIPNARDFTVITLYDEDWYNNDHEPDFDGDGSVSWDYYNDGWSATDDLLPILNEENGNTTPQMIYISDHGDTSLGMVKLYTYNTREKNYDYLGNLTNTNYFFVYDDSCYVGSYDYDDCFGEEITTIEHGAFATILNSRYGWGSGGNNLDSPSTQFTREFFQSVLGEGILELGRAHQEAKESNLWRLYTNFWGIRYIYYELNLFGDPELRLRVTEEISCTEEDTHPTTCGTGACASIGIETCIDGVWGGDT